MKSGSNSFHGSAYEYLRNEKIQARNFFSPTVPPLKRNQFGGTLGGPIRHDKVFFFADYEGARTRQGTTQNSNVPSVQQLNGDFSGGRPIFDPLTTAVNPANPSQFVRNSVSGQRHSGEPHVATGAYISSRWFPVPNNGPGLFVYSPSLSLDTDKFDIKISPRLTAKDSLVSRYSFVDNKEQDVQGYPALGYYPLHSRSQNAGLTYLHIFSPGITSEATFSYYRTYFLLLNASAFNGQNVVQQAGITGYEGISNLQPAGSAHQLFRLRSASGEHGQSAQGQPHPHLSIPIIIDLGSWQAPDEVRRATFSPGPCLFPRSKFAGVGFTSMASTRKIRSAPETRATPSPISSSAIRTACCAPRRCKSTATRAISGLSTARTITAITRNLTLNIGFRWELNSFLAGIRGQTNAFDFTTGNLIVPTVNGTPDLTAQPGAAQIWNVFRPLLETSEQKGLPWSIRYPDNRDPAPRIGLAWRAFGSDKWVVRSAYGIFYIFPDTNQTQGQINAPPFQLTQTINNDVPTATTLTPTRNLANFFLGNPLVAI